MLVALAVRMDEMANLRQQLFDQHGLIQTQAVLGLLKRKETEEEDGQGKVLRLVLGSGYGSALGCKKISIN